VHRIGQNRGVQVFKLITKDTIEERIDWLIKDKLRLIDTLNTEEGPDLFKSFTKKELLQLVESLS
jgi:SNF2 family DNA or RNA helicase